MSFSDYLKRAVEKTEKNIIDIHKKTVTEIHETEVSVCPVDTGFFSSNFKLTVDAEPPSTPESGYDQKKTFSRSPLPVTEIDSIKVGSESVNYNNTSYGPLLESGTVNMAPRPTMKKAKIAGEYELRKGIAAAKIS